MLSEILKSWKTVCCRNTSKLKYSVNKMSHCFSNHQTKLNQAKLLAILGSSKFSILQALKDGWKGGKRHVRQDSSLSIPTSLWAGCGHPVLLHVSPSLGLPASRIPSPA